MMARSTLAGIRKSRVMSDVIFMALVGGFIGTMGGLVNEPAGGLVSAAVLPGIFGAYNKVLKRNNGIASGMVAGSVMGALVGVVGLVIGGSIDGAASGAVFGIARGLVIGAAIGVVTRAKPDAGDRWITKLFLAVGSVGLGALLGAGVGLTAGVMLGVIGDGWPGAISAAVVGAVFGSYLGSYYKAVRWILTGAVIMASLAVVSLLIGGAFAGIVLGAITGSFAPMLLVAAIGATGGLTSRGAVAMVVEAIEAPSEMLTQGVVPFLVPALLVGLVIGSAASGAGGLIALPTSLAVVGLIFGVLGEVEGRPNNEVTVRSIVEMAMMGANEWPIGKVVAQVTGKGRKKAITGVITGVVAGLVGGGVGVLTGQLVIRFLP